MLTLLTLLVTIGIQGYPALSWRFLTSPPSGDAATTGIAPALMGTIWVCMGCAAITLPMGISTAIFLEEYQPAAPSTRKFWAAIQLNIANLAGVPSIVYGLLGLTAFVNLFGLFGTANRPHFEWGAEFFRQYITEGQQVVLIPVASRNEIPSLANDTIATTAAGTAFSLHVIGPLDDYPEDEALLHHSLFSDDQGGLYVNERWYYFRLPFGRSVLAASLTLMLVVLPVVIIATQESLRAVPASLREGALGLGATRWSSHSSSDLAGGAAWNHDRCDFGD